MARRHQGGSIAGFIIIGAVLVIGGAGLLYWVSHRDASPAKTPEVTVPVASEKNDTKQPNQTETESSHPNSEATQKPANDTQANQAPASTPSAEVKVEQIPQTGPADTLLQLLIIGLLVGTTAAFIRSRRYPSTL